jgi:hypothetical protein
VIFLALGIGIAAILLAAQGHKDTSDDGSVIRESAPITITSQTQSSKISGTPPRRTSALDAIKLISGQGKPVSRGLVEQAMRDSFVSGDIDSMVTLHEVFNRKPKAVERRSRQPDVVVGKNSPIQGVQNEQWQEFVGKLKTQPATYRDAVHVGAFHHNTRRLEEIGISPNSLTDENQQYAALEKDIQDARERYRKLINDYVGDVVTVVGLPHCVTMSGVLGLIKSAGAEGAKEWLTSESDRQKYPNTTKQFLLTNGLF